MYRLNGKVVLVTGAARGIGAAVARAQVAEGARVVIGDVLDDEGAALAESLGPAATYVHLDVTSRADWESAVKAAVTAYGRLDVLVNNAGVSIPGRIDEYSYDVWDKVVAINLTGVFYGIRAAVPALKDAGGGSIVNVSSLAGLRALPAAVAYVATKFGVRGLTKAAAVDLGEYGIRVNSVHPGFISTPMTATAQPDMSGAALGRIGEPEEVAKLIVFLSSDESSFSTGSEFVVDGGADAGDANGGSRRVGSANDD